MYWSTRSAPTVLATTIATAVGSVMCVTLLTGCSQTGYSIFDRRQTVDDMLPRAIIDIIDVSDFDLSTSRLSATYDDVDYYLLRPSGGNFAPCLAMINDAGPTVVCGGGGGRGEVTTGDDPRVQLVPEPARGGRGWVVISDNLRVLEQD
ncbi:MAG: hypothetical protein JWM50_1665 [Microbacteriaceae bacterium]|jgi:hypothetical protein|nr:hypothetical protein [Microbacteriaceae bacterium]